MNVLKASLHLLVLASAIPDEVTVFKPQSRFAEWKDPFFHYNFNSRSLAEFLDTSDRLILLIMNKLDDPA
jgi:hypothetical protein